MAQPIDPTDKYSDPVEKVTAEFTSMFAKLKKELGALAEQSSGSVVDGAPTVSKAQQGTATIDNKGSKVTLDEKTIEALTGDRKGFKGRKDRVKKTKRELLGLKELPHENAGAAAADALINKKKGLRGAAGAAVKFTANKIKQSLIEKFDPLRVINRATGGSKIATVMAGKAMFRSENSIRQIAGMDRRMGIDGTSADRNQGEQGKQGSTSPTPTASGASEGSNDSPILTKIEKGVAQVGAILMRIAERQGVATKHLEELSKTSQEALAADEKVADAMKAEAAGQDNESASKKEGGLDGLLKGFDIGKLFDKIMDMVINKGIQFILKAVMTYLPLIILGLTAAWVAFTTDWENMWKDLVYIWEEWVKDIGNWFGEMWTSLKTIWTDITAPVVKVFEDLIGGITSKVEELWATIKPFWETLTGAIQSVTGAIMDKVNGVLEFLGIKKKEPAEVIKQASAATPMKVASATPMKEPAEVIKQASAATPMKVASATPMKVASATPMKVASATPTKEPWGGPQTVDRIKGGFSKLSEVGSNNNKIKELEEALDKGGNGKKSGEALQQAYESRENALGSGRATAATNQINAPKTTNVTNNNNNTTISQVMASPRNSESIFMRAGLRSHAAW